MPYKYLYIFVEGPDDVRFFNSDLIKSVFFSQFTDIQIIPYAGMTKASLIKFIRGINYNMSSFAKYIFVKDLDKKTCITQKKTEVITEYSLLENDRIIIAAWEIESWYLAGLNDEDCAQLGITSFTETNTTTKENYNSLIANKYEATEFMIECLKRYKKTVARGKNKSFDYLLKPSTLRKII